LDIPNTAGNSECQFAAVAQAEIMNVQDSTKAHKVPSRGRAAAVSVDAGYHNGSERRPLCNDGMGPDIEAATAQALLCLFSACCMLNSNRPEAAPAHSTA
jgi:hypothetical protein